MKVGDLVKHKSDGAVGVVVDEPFTEVHISAMLPSSESVDATLAERSAGG